jgi:hypothetical protein
MAAAGGSMDIESAEKQLKALDHSEQHYFNRQVCVLGIEWFLCRIAMLTLCASVITTMVSKV